MFDQQQIYVVSAPSGGGKTTLNRRLLAEHPVLDIAVSHTTRAARASEQAGVHYYFVSKGEFEERVKNGEFLEHATVHGHLYGTSKAEVERIGKAGKKTLLEIDVQGWINAKPLIPQAISIFILPPSLEILWQRLEHRGSDPLPVRWLRLQNAYNEIEKANNYDFFIANDDLEISYRKLKSIIIDGMRGDIDNKNGRELVTKLKDEFKHADWICKMRANIY